MWRDEKLGIIQSIAVAAGEEILAVYAQAEGIEISKKDDDSPLTEADRRAHNVIVAALAENFPDIPVLSEESDSIPFSERGQWQRYWLVDPLDGTKEFIKRNGEFTVNIALIENGKATMGVVHVPVKSTTYLGKVSEGAWKITDADGKEGRIEAISGTVFKPGTETVRVVASRSHRGEIVDRLVAHMETTIGEVEVVSMGSSLKICLCAEGSADIYPRLAPTCEWDTAAAHAVLSAAGGTIVNTNFEELSYNQKSELLNPYFIAVADSKFNWADCLSAVELNES